MASFLQKQCYPLIFTCLLFLNSCGRNKTSEIIIGEWEVIDVEISESELSPELTNLLKEEMHSTHYHFEENGKFRINSATLLKEAVGAYRINDDKSEVYLEYKVDGKLFKSTYPVEITDRDKIIFRQDFGRGMGKMKAVLVRK